jgi:hypothetical protein
MDRVHGGVQRACGRVHAGPRVIGGRRVGRYGPPKLTEEGRGGRG